MHTRRSVGIPLIGGEESVFPYRAVGKRKGPDFIWGWQEDEWKRYKVTIRIRDELVCMYARIHGGDIHSFGCGG